MQGFGTLDFGEALLNSWLPKHSARQGEVVSKKTPHDHTAGHPFSNRTFETISRNVSDKPTTPHLYEKRMNDQSIPIDAHM